jgi:hypothetical protein
MSSKLIPTDKMQNGSANGHLDGDSKLHALYVLHGLQSYNTFFILDSATKKIFLSSSHGVSELFLIECMLTCVQS